MKLPTDNHRLGNDFGTLLKSLSQLLPTFAAQVNAVSEGRISGHYNALESAPAGGLYSQGDYIRNAKPSVLGTAGSRYVVKGWLCTVGGDPGTWVEDRGLTGT